MKKALSLIIALVLVATMAFTVYAADTYTVTINNAADGHTYEAYQIFTGVLSGGTLSNVQWGANVSSAGQTALGDADDVAAGLNDSNVAAFADQIAQYITGTPAGTSTDAGSTYTITGLAAGYYFIKDSNNSLDGDYDSYTSYILKVVKDTTANPKSSVPTVQKKVKDINDSTETALSSWQDSADHDIGDTVPLQLTATLADNVTSYESYSITFHDTMSAGLAFKEIVSVKVVNGQDVAVYNATSAPDGYKLNTTVNQDGTTTLTIEIVDVKTYGATNSSQVVVEYNATLDTDAVLGSAGNPNVVKLEYSNNPNQVDTNGDGKDDTTNEAMDTGMTPEDRVIVFTYKTVINKVASDANNVNQPLSGAEFTLKKYNETTNAWEVVTQDTTDNNDTVFTFIGIDDGIYELTETTTPGGYNSIDPIYFVVSATHTNDGDSNPLQLTALSATQSNSDGSNLTTGLVATFTGTVGTGEISTNIVNQKGATLPETGGIGTTIFYVVGGLLMLVAVVVLVAKKRVSAED